MSRIEVTSIYGGVLFSYECDGNTLKKTVEEAVRQGANLSGANLIGADLSKADLARCVLIGANLRGAYLRGTDLRRCILIGANLKGADLRECMLVGYSLRGAYMRGACLREATLEGESLHIAPVIATGLTYWVLITEGYMQVDDKRYTHKEWAGFSDDEVISLMDDCALEFWKQWRNPLLAMCEAHRAKVI